MRYLETPPKTFLPFERLFGRFQLKVKAALLLTLPMSLLGCGTAVTSKNTATYKQAPKASPVAIRSISIESTAPWAQVITPLLVLDIRKYHIPVKVIGVRIITFEDGSTVDVVAWKSILGSGEGNPLSIGAFTTSSGTKPKLISYLIRSFDETITPNVLSLVRPLQTPNTNTVYFSIDPKVWLKDQSKGLSVCAMAAVGPKVALALMRQSNFIFDFGWYKGNFHLLAWKMSGKRDMCS